MFNSKVLGVMVADPCVAPGSELSSWIDLSLICHLDAPLQSRTADCEADRMCCSCRWNGRNSVRLFKIPTYSDVKGLIFMHREHAL